MWETPFDPSMIGKKRIIVHCPNEFLVSDLLEILESHGVKWCMGGGCLRDNTCWDTYGEDTCYWIDGKELSYGNTKTVEANAYTNFFRCTFYGVHGDKEENDGPIDENEWLSILVK